MVHILTQVETTATGEDEETVPTNKRSRQSRKQITEEQEVEGIDRAPVVTCKDFVYNLCVLTLELYI
jgi:hypothetical protein